MKYIVSGEKRTVVSAEIEVEALTREEAVAKFEEQHPDLIPEYVGVLTHDEDGDAVESEDWTIVGFEEGTGKPVFEDDDYYTDEYGCITLAKSLVQQDLDEMGITRNPNFTYGDS